MEKVGDLIFNLLKKNWLSIFICASVHSIFKLSVHKRVFVFFIDIRQLDEWYVKDEYSVPALYKLKPIQDVSKNRKLW